MVNEADSMFADTQDRFRILAERLPQLVWTALPSGYHDWFSQRCQDYTGLSLKDLNAQWKTCIHPDDVERARSAWHKALDAGSAYEVEYRIKGADDIYRRFLVRALPMQGSQGEIVRWFGTCTDLSTIVEMRPSERTGQAEKMEAMGQLTGSVIHDFNNLLTVVLGNLELIAMRSADEAVLRFAGSAVEAARRGVTLTSQLLAFTRAQSVEISAVNVNELIRGMDDLLRRSLGPEVTIALDLDARIPAALGNANQLELAILNLAINARDAMAGKGRLAISSRVETDRSASARTPSVVITVGDSGTGMGPDILARAFEPFFTTKTSGKGTGLGLAQVRSIARQSGGDVTIDSTPGQGTRVNIFLPVTAGYSSPAHSDPIIASPMKGSSEIILVIDDDADVRRYMVESLSSLAYIVFEAPDAQSGLKLLDDMCPDLLIVDFAMPGLTGSEIIDEVTRKCPAMPVILTSGTGGVEMLDHWPPSVRILPKPFRIAELSGAVAQALASRLPVSDPAFYERSGSHAAG